MHTDTFQQVLPQRFGFITYYSLKNQAEDFAEIFRYYILHNKYFLSTSENRKTPQFKKPMKDNKLKEKYDFMKKIIGEEGVKINEDLLNIDEYKPRG